MNYKQTEKAFRLFFLSVLAISLLIILLLQNKAHGQTNQVRYHQKIQKERSYEQWKKDQPKLRIRVVKDAVKQSKEVYGKNNQSARLKRKEIRIRKQIKK